MATTSSTEKKGHICPPSNAKHPSDRWEALFVYAFICKFTNLRGKVEGLETPMDFENALLGHEPNPILTKILAHFVLNLRPQTRNLSADQISSTVASVMSEHLKTSERTVFWNDDLKRNADPFDDIEGGIFAATWDLKLKILRVLVEMQLLHTPDIKNIIDRAWGVSLNKSKKKDPSLVPPGPTEPNSLEQLQLVPLGQDIARRRYWVIDAMIGLNFGVDQWHRAYEDVTATFETIASTKEEYLNLVEGLKSASPPPDPKGKKRKPKLEQTHQQLIKALEDREPAIDAELARVQKVRRKIEARNALMAQAEIRETRTRRQTQRPDYVYHDANSEDDDDDYNEEDEEDDQFEDDDFSKFRTDESGVSRSRRSGQPPTARRRSTRTAAMNSDGKRGSQGDPWADWRGERRSTRLGAPSDGVAPATKRARTEESTISTGSGDAQASGTSGNAREVGGIKVNVNGAAAVKPSETVVEQIAGKKKSKFWVYAVEPTAEVPSSTRTNGTGAALSGSNGLPSIKEDERQSTSPIQIDAPERAVSPPISIDT